MFELAVFMGAHLSISLKKTFKKLNFSQFQKNTVVPHRSTNLDLEQLRERCIFSFSITIKQFMQKTHQYCFE